MSKKNTKMISCDMSMESYLKNRLFPHFICNILNTRKCLAVWKVVEKRPHFYYKLFSFT